MVMVALSGDIDVVEFTGTVKVVGWEAKRGENQSPRKSKKQRSDQWQEEMKRMSRSAEQ